MARFETEKWYTVGRFNFIIQESPFGVKRWMGEMRVELSEAMFLYGARTFELDAYGPTVAGLVSVISYTKVEDSDLAIITFEGKGPLKIDDETVFEG